ncbi:MAG: sialate O-acetylesterase [Bacteroidales bacterium]|nr:sialate O-acetylesterase [Bacteroidales bacterium]
MDMLHKISSTIIAATLSIAATAVELPDVIGHNMVLQQCADAHLWGWSTPDAQVDIVTSWNNRNYHVKANADGRWEVAVATPKASFSEHEIRFHDKNSTVTAKHVLVGEVWFCSGQSNMEMPLNGFWTQPIADSNREIAFSGKYRGKIRMATVSKTGALKPADRVSGEWKECEPENAAWFSAVGYHFAKALTEMLCVPVGIINCSWGGSHVEGWLPKNILKDYADINLADAGNKDIREWDQPMIMYNGMLNPLVGYTVKGFLWNQGESNVGQHSTYANRLATMVKLWRQRWQQDSLPFYMVEIPPYSYGDVKGTKAAMLREAQHKAASIIPNSGIISTSDLVKPHETEDIHASTKQPIGERLAFMAAVKTYGIGGIACDSPTYKSMDIDGNTAILHFNNAPDGFTPNRNLQGFECAGSDRVFHPATAEEIYDTRDIRITCPAVDKIVAVRYCFHNWEIGSVHNLRWLPLVPFRTDDWDN